MVILIIGIILILIILIVGSKKQHKKQEIDSNTNILITGGCMGIGYQLALILAQKHKCNLIIIDIKEELSQNLIEKISDFGGKAFFFKCDLSDIQQIQKIFQAILKKFQKIDLLINNAGVVTGKLFLDSSFESIEKTMNINYQAPVTLIKLFLPEMIKRKKGHIINVCSIMAFATGIGVTDYCASKSALFNFHQSLKLELKKEKIPIDLTIICPYVINTGMFDGIKIKFNKILGMLHPKKVAQIIYESIRNKSDVVLIPWYYKFLLFAMNMTPQFISEKILLYLQKDAVENFKGRQNTI